MGPLVLQYSSIAYSWEKYESYHYKTVINNEQFQSKNLISCVEMLPEDEEFQSKNLISCMEMLPGDEEFQSKNLISCVEMLPEDLILKIFTLLPAADGIRVGLICKASQKYIPVTKCILNDDYVPSHKPWYCIFMCHASEIIGYSYDSESQYLNMFDFLNLKSLSQCTSYETPSFDYTVKGMSSSHGLVCIRQVENKKNVILVCNPILKRWKWLPEVPNNKDECFEAVALSVDIQSETYCAAMISSAYDMSGEKEVSVGLYDSKRKSWWNVCNISLDGWKYIRRAVICNGVLYILIWRMDLDLSCYVVVRYDLRSTITENSLADLAIVLPSEMWVVVEMSNLCGKLILVGFLCDGISRKKKALILLELCGTEWNEVSRMPNELLDIFEGCVCSGFNDLVYLLTWNQTIMAIFNLSRNTWKFVNMSPNPEKNILNQDTDTFLHAFCWEPRLDICP